MNGFWKRRTVLLSLEAGVPLAFLTLWWLMSEKARDPFFPPLSEILERFQALWLFDHLRSDILPSVGNLVIGFSMAAIAGVALGILFALVPAIQQILYPAINFYRAVPTVAVIPVFIALLGFGNEVRLLIIVLAALPPTLIATLDGMRSVEPLLKDLGSVFHFTRSERVMRVYLPAASPQIISGLQVSLQLSFIVMIASEMLGATRGIGAMTLLAQQTFTSTDMWAGVILLGLIGYISNLLLKAYRDRSLRWYDGAKQTERTA